MIIVPSYNDVRTYSDNIIMKYHKDIIKPKTIWTVMEKCIKKANHREEYTRYRYNHINYSKTTIPSKIVEVSDTIEEGEYGVFFTITTELINRKFVKRMVMTVYKLTDKRQYINVVLHDNEIGKPFFFRYDGTVIRNGAILNETQWRILFSLNKRK